MNTIHWKNLDMWNARKFAFWFNNKIIGQLAFTSFWNYSATYSYDDALLTFSEVGFWRQKIVIQQNNKIIALIEKEFSGGHILQLRSGERYTLSTNFWGNNVRWVNVQGKAVVKYVQDSFTYMQKGTIHFDDRLNKDLQNILTSSGLFTRQLIRRRAFLAIIPIIIMGVRHL